MYQNAQLAHWFLNKDKKNIIPIQADIDLTNHCNQDCYYCISSVFRAEKPVHQHYTKFIELIDKLSSWREHTPNSYGTLQALTFAGGGEPTLLKDYHKVIEHAIDQGFLVSLTTNGTMLDKLYKNVDNEKLKLLNWIGIDIDSGNPETYEKIRKSFTKNMFTRVVQNAKELRLRGVSVDFKLLACEHNTTEKEIDEMFALGKEVDIRMIYYRPVILNGIAFDIDDTIVSYIQKSSEKYNVPYKINKTKSEKRNYKKCHQMFQYPSFCADGNVYTCCDHKGDSRFLLGSWIEKDIRDLWLSDRHWEIYEKINTHLCPPCRPNKNNIEIQNCISDKSLLSILNT
jgi:molybdenum cofactor biosynthesis enzyme MoaA